MATAITAMLHVSDVRRSTAWFESIGLTLLEHGDDDGERVWAMLALGAGRAMLNAGGTGAGGRQRRDADLYIEVDDVDARFAALPAAIDVVEPPHDTFYGMREFIVRDRDGFWLTFGQVIAATGTA